MSGMDRQEMLRNAVSFLQDPQTRASPMTQRVQFLEAKGLTPVEVEEAFRQTFLNATYRTPYYQEPPFQLNSGSRPWDWRDMFIMGVTAGSFAVGAVSLARRYLLPHLQPPSSTAYEADKDALAAQFDAAEALLKEIQAETAAIKQSVEEQREKVEETTKEVQGAVTELKEGEARNRDDIREIRDEVNSIREMLPKMIEKNKESQSQSLAELQQELKSLKALLLSRGSSFPLAPSPVPSFTGRPAIPSWQLAGSSAADATPAGGSSTLNGPSTSTISASVVDEPKEAESTA